MTEPSPFLSETWIAEARAIRAEHAGQLSPPANPVKVNLVVRDVPFGEPTLDAHLDTTAGELDIELGHVDGAEVTVTLDYATARSIVVDQDPQAVMGAFLGGRIKVDGDVTKVLLLLQQAPPAGRETAEAPAGAADLAARIREMTAD